MCICMSKSFYEKINVLLFVQYESEHVMNLGTEFAMLCTIYYLVYGSKIFSDYLFLQEATVLLKR